MSSASRQRALPLLHRSYELMRQTKSLPSYSVPLIRRVFAGCHQSLLGWWSFPTLSLQSLHRCLDPYPGMPLWCPRPFLPRELQPQPRCTDFGASNIPPQCNFNDDPISGRQSFRYVQAPMVASPPGCTYRAGSMSCGQPGRLRHAMDWKLPSRTVVSLHDRIGQLS